MSLSLSLSLSLCLWQATLQIGLDGYLSHYQHLCRYRLSMFCHNRNTIFCLQHWCGYVKVVLASRCFCFVVLFFLFFTDLHISHLSPVPADFELFFLMSISARGLIRLLFESSSSSSSTDFEAEPLKDSEKLTRSRMEVRGEG